MYAAGVIDKQELTFMESKRPYNSDWMLKGATAKKPSSCRLNNILYWLVLCHSWQYHNGLTQKISIVSSLQTSTFFLAHSIKAKQSQVVAFYNNTARSAT